MIAFQRLSTCPTVPELLRREADRRAARLCGAVPAAAWWRPTTIAVVWDHSLNGRLGDPWPDGSVRSAMASPRPAADLGRNRAGSRGRTAQRPMRTRSNALARSRRAAMQAGPTSRTLRSWRCQAGMAACFAGAVGLLATTRALNWLCLLSPDGIALGVAGADRLTRAGMRLWRWTQLQDL